MDKLLEGLLDSVAQAGVTDEKIKELMASLTSLADTADTVREVFRNTWEALETGARMQGLSSATGESVAKLYEFERGLDAVGERGGYLRTIFADMRQALAVAGDNNRVGSAFEMMDLNPKKLRGESTMDAVLDVAGAMGKLDPDDAAQAGHQIFGRFQTETILAIAHNMDLFRHEMAGSSDTGAWLEKYSKAFEGMKLPQMMEEQLANAVIIARNRLGAGDLGPDAKSRGLGPDHFKPEFTMLEKMGFIMSGAKVQNPYEQRNVELLQQIVENTRQPPHASVMMPDNRNLRDIVDPAPFMSNIV